MDRPSTTPVSTRGATERALSHLRSLIAAGELEPGSRLPSERELARRVRVARPTIRAAIRALARLGVVRSVPGVGSFVVPAMIDAAGPRLSLSSLAGTPDATIAEMRRIIEPGGAALAAERASADHCAAIAGEVTDLYAAVSDPHLFFLHDLRFHRAVAAASGNSLLMALVELLTEVAFDRARRRPALVAADALRHAATTHRRIYHAIRERDVVRARTEMEAHLAAPDPAWTRTNLQPDRKVGR